MSSIGLNTYVSLQTIGLIALSLMAFTIGVIGTLSATDSKLNPLQRLASLIQGFAGFVGGILLITLS